jgi:hypothetical protein
MTGELDDADRPDACSNSCRGCPTTVREPLPSRSTRARPSHWDSLHGSATYMIGARQGQGGIVNVVADAGIASRSRARVVAFFRKHLGVD